ncbi:hypothetical protein ECANGB1_2170 [Enterospora canceri]|uniref:Uncharacterized protein n=1 Tax=Enterospora canceri TaxID=1081671 RepID=A0A1Y1S4X1_9MICR|nr:hypothetical protein ECANGB1_2170 [Enterospora canceri]
MDKHCFTKGDIHAEIYRVNKQLFEDQIMAAMESMYGNNYEDVCIGDEGDDQDEYLELREQRKRELRDAIEQKPHRLCEAVNRMTALRKTDDSSESVKISKPRTTLFHRAFNYIKNLLIALWKRVFNKQ